MNARSIERKLVRQIGRSWTTITGKINQIQEVTPKAIRFTTEAARQVNAISRKKLRAAINYFQDAKTITRKDLEAFGAFTSAIFALLAEAFAGSIKIQILATGLIRITLRGIRYIFAGVDRAVRDMEVAADNGAKFFLMNFWHIKDRKSWKQHIQRLGVKLILDSGAFTAWTKGVQICVKEFAAFVQEHRDVIHSFFNLDVIGDAAASRKNFEYLKECGLDPIPVFHAGDDKNILDEMVEAGHPVIGIGGSVKMAAAEREAAIQGIFDRHPAQNFHFLGGGSADLLNRFEWYSADSTSWIAARKYNVIVDAAGQRKAPDADPISCMAATVQYYVGLGVIA